jgi:hypothetical protein
MSIEVLRALLGWCTLINFAVLLVWFLAFLTCSKQILALHRHWVDIDESTMKMVNYGLMGLFKLLILMFNLGPYLALRLAG